MKKNIHYQFLVKKYYFLLFTIFIWFLQNIISSRIIKKPVFRKNCLSKILSEPCLAVMEFLNEPYLSEEFKLKMYLDNRH